MKSVPLSSVPAALTACPTQPRCVSTVASNAKQKMPPIAYLGEREQAQAQLRVVLAALPHTLITQDLPGYLAAEVSSRLVGFVDDVEFLFDTKAAIIQFRSGARIGYYDFKVNRERMEKIAREFAAAQTAAGSSAP